MLTKLSTKGQIVLPDAIRRKLGLRPGDTLEASAQDGVVTLTPRQRKTKKLKIVVDPLTGFAALESPPGATPITGKLVRSIIEEFP